MYVQCVDDGDLLTPAVSEYGTCPVYGPLIKISDAVAVTTAVWSVVACTRVTCAYQPQQRKTDK